MTTVALILLSGGFLLLLYAFVLAVIRLKELEAENLSLEIECERKARQLARLNYDLDRLFQPYPRK